MVLYTADTIISLSGPSAVMGQSPWPGLLRWRPFCELWSIANERHSERFWAVIVNECADHALSVEGEMERERTGHSTSYAGQGRPVRVKYDA